MSTTEWKNEVELANFSQNPVKLRKVLLNEKGQRIEGPVEGPSGCTGIPECLSSYTNPAFTESIGQLLDKWHIPRHATVAQAAQILRAAHTKPPRSPVSHTCPECGETIQGTRAFRAHKPKCKI